MCPYRLLSYSESGAPPEAGVLIDGMIYRAAALLPDVENCSSVMGLLRSWDVTHERLSALSQDRLADDGVSLAKAKLHAPILYPGALFCAGANYRDHLEEMGEVSKRLTGEAPSTVKAAEPWFFIKTAAGSIVGPGADVRLPSFSEQVDWEAELGVVIGRPTRNVTEARALEAVTGYLIVNDLSARDLMKREGSPFVFDWIGQKCFDDAAPMGPWLTPAAYLRDPNNLAIKLWVNGVLKQESNTSRMVHGIAEQIAYLSRHVTLWPGDVIATGTPAGVGMARGDFLKIGDEVRIEIDGCGELINRMVADDVSARER